MGGTAPLLRVVAPLRPGLLLPVAHHDGRVHDQGQLLRGAARKRPALPDHSPQQFVQKRDHALGRQPQPAPESRGVRHPGPAEDPAHVPPLQQGQVVHHPAAVEKQRDPHLGHPARAEKTLLLLCPAVDPARQGEPVEQLADQNQPAAVGKIARAVPDAQRPSGTLYMGPASGMMMSHRPGDLRFGSFFVQTPRNLRPWAGALLSPHRRIRVDTDIDNRLAPSVETKCMRPSVVAANVSEKVLRFRCNPADPYPVIGETHRSDAERQLITPCAIHCDTLPIASWLPVARSASGSFGAARCLIRSPFLLHRADTSNSKSSFFEFLFLIARHPTF